MDRAGQVLDGDLLAAVGGGFLARGGARGERQGAGGEADLGARHAGGAVVVGAPGVVVVPVGIEGGLRVEGGQGDHDVFGEGGEGEQQSCEEGEGLHG